MGRQRDKLNAVIVALSRLIGDEFVSAPIEPPVPALPRMPRSLAQRQPTMAIPTPRASKRAFAEDTLLQLLRVAPAGTGQLARESGLRIAFARRILTEMQARGVVSTTGTTARQQWHLRQPGKPAKEAP